MKILVPIKRVADPDNANKVRVPSDGSKIDTANLKPKPNPFDEYAVETALRLTENGAQAKVRAGEVVVVTLGPKECESELTQMLATGADRCIRVDAQDDQLDGFIVAQALKSLAEKEKPDFVIMGKQAVDGDTNQVGQFLAEMLGWPMATSVATIVEEGGALVVGREVDGGVIHLKLRAPAVVTVDLRVVAPTSVYSSMTSRGFKYNEGVRFASLPAITKAKKKPREVMKLEDVVSDNSLRVEYVRFEPPVIRKAGVKVADVCELVDKLKNEARAI
ncbi:MAG: electron transfer flavoprotein subunit beta/FixA family protein [Polyangiaceae bacterium]|nr:electron transfer flavoprotein subunit beta/FixA family protein [Polyangiaceae bacterium]